MNQPPDQSRPDFEPPMGSTPASAVQVVSSTPPRRRVGAGGFAGGVFLLLIVVFIALVFYLQHRGLDDVKADRPSRPAAVAPPSLTHPLPTPGPRPRDPLLQQRWAAVDDVYPMDLNGMTFSFRAPGSWGCRVSSLAGVRWVCMDESGLLSGTRSAHPSRVMVQSDECKAPCAATDYASVVSRLRALSLDTTGMHVVNSRTRVSDAVDPADPTLRFYRMSRTYDSNGDGMLDRHLWVQAEVDADDRVPVQKMFGDLYDATR